MKRKLTTVLFCLLTLPLALPAADDKKGPRIQKCQDAQGRWHYGDTADEECSRSKVIELDTRGIKRKEIAAPLTEAELKAREQNRASDEAAKQQAEDQKRRDQQLLATYAIEDDIIMARDRKTADLEAQIKAGQDTLTSLRNSLGRLQAQAVEEQRGGKPLSPQTAKTIANNEAQISKHEKYVQGLRKDQETLRAQYQSDLERYREIKRGQPAPPSAPPKP